MARTNKVDGIIGVTFSDVEEYLDDTLAFVSIERRFSKNIPCVSGDTYLGGRMAAENLVRRGARICCLCRPLCQWTMRYESADLVLKGIVKERDSICKHYVFREAGTVRVLILLLAA